MGRDDRMLLIVFPNIFKTFNVLLLLLYEITHHLTVTISLHPITNYMPLTWSHISVHISGIISFCPRTLKKLKKKKKGWRDEVLLCFPAGPEPLGWNSAIAGLYVAHISVPRWTLIFDWVFGREVSRVLFSWIRLCFSFPFERYFC